MCASGPRRDRPPRCWDRAWSTPPRRPNSAPSAGPGGSTSSIGSTGFVKPRETHELSVCVRPSANQTAAGYRFVNVLRAASAADAMLISS
jgi:hypothetical protein